MNEYIPVAIFTVPMPKGLNIRVIHGIPPKEPIPLRANEGLEVTFTIAFDGPEPYCTATEYKRVK